ncbi:MAG: DUF1080 domain-containing protein [Verrucomicrobiota bacterium]|jgi:hypothetical protein
MKITAKIFLTGILSFFLTFVFAGCRTSSSHQSGGVKLFNGRNFSGWTFCMRSNSAPAKTWSVAHGRIHCTGQPFGYMRTEKKFHDYQLTVVWRFVKVATNADNSGIFVHIQPPDKVFPQCVECQGQYQHQGDFVLAGGVGADGHPANGKKYGFIPQTGPSNENPAGEWNTNRIVCRNGAIELTVNDRKMNQLTGCNLSSGFIGIQSEGGELEIRKMFLERLK